MGLRIKNYRSSLKNSIFKGEGAGVGCHKKKQYSGGNCVKCQRSLYSVQRGEAWQKRGGVFEGC